jgi:hypothetical protein
LDRIWECSPHKSARISGHSVLAWKKTNLPRG